ncbi:MAG: FeoA domain-containing protein [Candidatus Zixiibacteriota bacterium]|nr:MAG: FeoA domain-containing protein [candidate division Zixibacteria bacterium]
MEDHKGHLRDEFLEALYKAGEEGNLPIEQSVLNLTNPLEPQEIDSLITEGLIKSEDGKLTLTEKGREMAEILVRNHRLAERLFSEILDLKGSELESTSCSFEHILDNSVTESVCTFLGHPPTCPHGKRIPPGRCCRASRRQLKPIVMPLTELPVSSEARIAFITTPHHHRFGRLANLGLIPGGRITLLQKKPAYLLKLGSTEVAIDSDIAADIFVKQLSNEVPSA